MGQGRPDGHRGGGRPGGGDSQQASYDYDKQQSKYDEQMRKLLSDEQYEGYMKLKLQFYSQRRVREFLMGGNSMTGDSDGGDNCSFYGVNAALLVKGGIVTVEGGS